MLSFLDCGKTHFMEHFGWWYQNACGSNSVEQHKKRPDTAGNYRSGLFLWDFVKLSLCYLSTKSLCSHCLTGVDNPPLVKVFEGCGELFEKSSPQNPRDLSRGKTFFKSFPTKSASYVSRSRTVARRGGRVRRKARLCEKASRHSPSRVSLSDSLPILAATRRTSSPFLRSKTNADSLL